jgi:RNA polymerase sigma-70 factor (ECF subfamily)
MNTNADFVRLWLRHQTEVARYVSAMVPRADAAEAVLQDVSVALWEKWAEYDIQRPFVPWAIRFAYREILKWRQAQARNRLVFCEEVMESVHAMYEEEAPLMEARRQALGGCLEKLSPQERRWLDRRYARHGAIQQQAQEDGVSLNQIYYALEKIRTRLLNCIGQAMRKEGWGDV